MRNITSISSLFWYTLMPSRILLFCGALLASTVLFPSTGSAQTTPDRLAVIVGSVQDYDPKLATEAQEILVAAIEGRGSFLIVSRADLQAQAKFGSEEEVVDCLAEENCRESLRKKYLLKTVVYGQVSGDKDTLNLFVRVTRENGASWETRIQTPTSDGRDKFLSTVFDRAETFPVTGPLPKQKPKVAETITPPPNQKLNPQPDPISSKPSRLVRNLGIATTALGTASLVAGIWFHYSSLDAGTTLQNEIDASSSRAGGLQGITRERAKFLEGEVNDNAGFANLFYGVGAGVTAAGVGMILWDAFAHTEAHTSSRAEVLGWKLSVEPWVQPQTSAAHGSTLGIWLLGY